MKYTHFLSITMVLIYKYEVVNLIQFEDAL